MKTPAFWNDKTPLSTALVPFAALYALGARLKETAARPKTLSIPVICVGNAIAGGSGKTPVSLYIGERLKQKNLRAFFLSRGYGGSAYGPILVDPVKHSATEVGDEPLLLSRVLPTVVARDRLSGAQFAIAQGARVIVMDDGLQNFAFEKTLSLLVIDRQVGLGNQRVMPAGPLREPLRACVNRSDAIITIGDSKFPDLGDDIPQLLAQVTPQASMQALKGKKILAFCGLAYPQKFFASLRAAGAEILETAAFADHYAYTENDIRALVERAKSLGAIPVTTAKDAVRLSVELKTLITIADIALSFAEPTQLDALLDHATTGA